MRRLPWLVAAAMAYEAYAVETGHAPKITALVHLAVRHFCPVCPACGVKVHPARRPPYRGYLPVEVPR